MTYDFELRQGVKFHNGDPLPPRCPVQLERYKGRAAE